jgi:hypothetical protein
MNRDLLEKPPFAQLLKDIPALYEIRIFIIAFTRARTPVPILSHINPVHITPSYIAKIILLLTSHLCLVLPSGLFPSGFPTNILHAFLFSHKKIRGSVSITGLLERQTHTQSLVERGRWNSTLRIISFVSQFLYPSRPLSPSLISPLFLPHPFHLW